MCFIFLESRVYVLTLESDKTYGQTFYKIEYRMALTFDVLVKFIFIPRHSKVQKIIENYAGTVLTYLNVFF